jgi:hypothetical protein
MKRSAVALVLALAGCSVFGPGSELHQLHRHRDAWRALGITSYDFDYWKGCFCEPPRTMRIQVRDGLVTAAEFTDNGEQVSNLDHVPTIDSLFARMESQLSYNYKLDIKYHSTLRYPAEIRGDIPQAIDDEFTITVTNFAQLLQGLSLTRR